MTPRLVERMFQSLGVDDQDVVAQGKHDLNTRILATVWERVCLVEEQLKRLTQAVEERRT